MKIYTKIHAIPMRKHRIMMEEKKKKTFKETRGKMERNPGKKWKKDMT